MFKNFAWNSSAELWPAKTFRLSLWQRDAGLIGQGHPSTNRLELLGQGPIDNTTVRGTGLCSDLRFWDLIQRKKSNGFQLFLRKSSFLTAKSLTNDVQMLKDRLRHQKQSLKNPEMYAKFAYAKWISKSHHPIIMLRGTQIGVRATLQYSEYMRSKCFFQWSEL